MTQIDRIKIESTEQWQTLRRQDVTASAVAAIFGVHPWETIASLQARKLGMELPGPNPESAVIRRGVALEDVAAAEVGKLRPGWVITKSNEYLRDPVARLGATPDFSIVDDKGRRGVLQTKTVGSYKFKKEWGDSDEGDPTPPLWIVLQASTEAMLADAEFAAIGVLVIGDWVFDAHVIELERNSKAEHRIRVAVHQFWQAIAAGQVPAIDYERDADLVKLMYPAEVDGKVIDLRDNNRILELCDTRELQGSIIRAADKAKTAAETEIRALIGDAEIAMVRGWRVSLRTTEVAEQVRKAHSFRTLRTSRLKEEA